MNGSCQKQQSIVELAGQKFSRELMGISFEGNRGSEVHPESQPKSGELRAFWTFANFVFQVFITTFC